ncbi:PoNe immunity protein domain-containing protein [Vreelandella sp. EE27]
MTPETLIRDTRRSPIYFTSLLSELALGLQGEPTDPVNRLPDDRVRSAWQLFEGSLYRLIARYSQGAAVGSLKWDLDEVLRRREQLAEYGDKLPERQQVMRRSLEHFDPRFMTFDTYLYHLWWWSLAVCIGVSDMYRQRMLAVTGNTGQDALFDQLAVTLGATDRPMADSLCYPELHAPLLKITGLSQTHRPSYLQSFLNNWYAHCEPAAWYDNHLMEEDECEELADFYVGYWCFEAALMVALYEIDDTSFRNHPYYPADLARHYRASRKNV